MHDRQYRAQERIAKERFEKEVETLAPAKAATLRPGIKAASAAPAPQGTMPNYMSAKHPNATPVVAAATGQLLWELDFTDRSVPPAPGRRYKAGEQFCLVQASYALVPVTMTEGCTLVDTCFCQGAMVRKGDVIGWVE